MQRILLHGLLFRKIRSTAEHHPDDIRVLVSLRFDIAEVTTSQEAHHSIIENHLLIFYVRLIRPTMHFVQCSVSQCVAIFSSRCFRWVLVHIDSYVEQELTGEAHFSFLLRPATLQSKASKSFARSFQIINLKKPIISSHINSSRQSTLMSKPYRCFLNLQILLIFIRQSLTSSSRK